MGIGDLFHLAVSDYSTLKTVGILTVIFLIAAIAGGVVLYFLVFGKQKDGKYKGFMKWIYDFVHFRVLTIEAVIKILYLISAIAVTLTAFLQFAYGLIGLLLCPLQIILGNIVVRIAYEFAIMLILLVRNTNEINAKLKDQNGEGKTSADPFSVALPKVSITPAAPPAPKTGAKFCSGCGKALEAGAKFCDGCGKKCDE
ncbi:MAG: zinc ribbon domain-containing protein [Bacteroides sp.]|nr:zinc ribbon domain-containing protein [Eubacterium sp.]MCM1417499.1 zinc ribbon domain-containing protein [Roseburia sp.]MCM1462915.1 zinc ribbon domain-containing protein [Bacteroides sp.]